MIGHEINARSGDELVRVVRALGQHRYVAGRCHLVHAFVIEAAALAAPDPALEPARAWAEATLTASAVEHDSKDERLYRRVSDAELVLALGAFWLPGVTQERANVALASRLAQIGVGPPDPSVLPFDESHESDMFPVLVDAGWELLPLRSLDSERHRGAMGAFGDALAFDCAKFDEESCESVTLFELPALGAVELLAPGNEGGLRAPFVLWTSGNETYVDYVLRGVRKVAKLSDQGE